MEGSGHIDLLTSGLSTNHRLSIREATPSNSGNRHVTKESMTLSEVLSASPGKTEPPPTHTHTYCLLRPMEGLGLTRLRRSEISLNDMLSFQALRQLPWEKPWKPLGFHSRSQPDWRKWSQHERRPNALLGPKKEHTQSKVLTL